jgi:nitronate monooxygenase
MLPKLRIKNYEIQTPVIQGGMGIGISNYELAGNVSKEGGLGVLSSAALDRLVSKRYGEAFNSRKAAALEVQDAKKIAGDNPVGINIMVALQKDYEASVLGALDGGVDVIISGAGLPTQLPEIAMTHPRGENVALVPIASSGRALEIICKRWARVGKTPDAVIVEGPLAGGHIAWRSIEEAQSEKNSLEELLKDVLPVAEKYGNIPVIAAGGIFTHEDIEKYITMGCKGVQMGTRFLATYESGASDKFKERLVHLKEEEIVLADKPGSPCHMLFWVIKDCPFYETATHEGRPEQCDKGYLLHNCKCPAKENNQESFCICNGLLSASGYNNDKEEELYTVGANAYKVKKLLHVSELMKELAGQTA